MYKAPLSALAALVAAGALAAPGSAAADGPGTFCVHVSPCPPGAVDKGDDLEAALKAASGSVSTGNVILLGDKGSPYVGPFDLGLKVEAAVPGGLQPSAAGDFLLGTVKATGPGRPTLTAPPGKTVFKGASAKLDGVDVRLPDSGATSGIELSNGDLHDVTVSGPASPPPGSVGLAARGAVDIDGLRLKDAGARSLTGGAATAITARGLRVDTDEGGLDTFGADVRLTESRINTGGDSVDFSTGSLFVDHSAITSTGASNGISFTDGGLSLDHVTIAHRDRPNAAGAAIAVTSVDGLPTRANVHTTALAGYARGFRRELQTDAMPIDVRDSVWDPTHDDLGGPGAGSFTETGDAHEEPLLVDPTGGDLRPRAGSPAIDRDTRTDGRFRDLDGASAVDGDGNGSVAADAGALEYRRLAPRIDSTAVPASGTVGQALDFSVTPSDPDADRTTTAWAFDDGGSASGAQARHSYATPGTRTAVVTVTDETGLTTTRTFDVAIAAAGLPGGGQPGSGAQGGVQPGVPPADVKAPKLSSLKLSSRKTRVAKARGVKLKFALDEPATISIVAQRGKRSAKTTRAAGQGKDALKLAGALKKLGKLSPGSVSFRVTATDAAGNRSAPRLLKLKLSR